VSSNNLHEIEDTGTNIMCVKAGYEVVLCHSATRFVAFEEAKAPWKGEFLGARFEVEVHDDDSDADSSDSEFSD
jgi:hypothetical protein